MRHHHLIRQEVTIILIRHRTKTLIRSGVIGAAITGVPLLMLLFSRTGDLHTARETLAHYESMQEETKYMTVCVLNSDVAAGDQITESLVTRKTISVVGNNRFFTADSSDLTGCRAKISLTAGTILSTDFVYAGDEITDDERTVELSHVALPSSLAVNDFVDIRIAFPDGEDYIIARQKRVYDLLTDEDQVTGFVLRLGEEDILRIQSASVDTSRYEDTSLYAIQYVSDHQAGAEEFYPVNDAVLTLLHWDPNIAELFTVPDERRRRAKLEENNEEFLSNGNFSDTGESEAEFLDERTQKINEALEIYDSYDFSQASSTPRKGEDAYQ